MFTPRGVTVCVAGVAMWFVARLIGSAGLEVVGIGFVLLPVVAGRSGSPTRSSRWCVAAIGSGR